MKRLAIAVLKLPFVRRRRLHEQGQIIILVGLAAIVLFGIIGLAVDVGRLYAAKAELSRAVDAAALAGVVDFPDTDAAEATATAYLNENEPGATPSISADTDNNSLTVNATKTVRTTFIRVFGIDTASVSAHAKAGFGVGNLDAALLIDSTGSMDDGCNSDQDNSGCPIHEAKDAASAFKDRLLGTNPSGNVSVGVAAFRGCFRASPETTTAPMDLTSKSVCIRDDNTSNTQVSDLSYNLTTLNDLIDNIRAQGGSGTNICGGLAKGWEILNGPGNHLSEENHARYLILLSDGDSNYYGQYTWQSSPQSPASYEGHSCQPPASCSASPYNVGGESNSSTYPCHNGVNTESTETVSVDDSLNSSSWTGGSGWIANSWTISGTASKTTSSSPQSGSRHAQLGRSSSIPSSYGTISRTFSLSGTESATLSYYAKRNSNVSGSDTMVVEMICGGTTYTLATRTSSNTNTGYPGSASTADMTSCAGQSSVTLRFRVTSMNSTSDDFYIDTISVAGYTENPTPADGYQNGQDSSPVGCSVSRPRERQLDMLTWEMAKALKADDVEIFVVGFGACSPDSTVYTESQCDAQIGNTADDNTADERLLKCVASSDDSTNNHYYYVADANDLPAIFGRIASQISHRLIE